MVKLKLFEKLPYFSIKKKLILTGAGTILAFFILIGFALFGINSYEASNDELLSAVEKNNLTSKVKSELSQINNAISLELIDGKKRAGNLDYSKTKLKTWLEASVTCPNDSNLDCNDYRNLGKEYYQKANSLQNRFDLNEKQTLVLKNRLGAIYTEIFSMFNTVFVKKIEILKKNSESQKNKGTFLKVVLIIVASLSGVIILLVFFLLIRTTVKPITITKNKLEELSRQGGDLSRFLPVISHDEIGDMTESFNAFLCNLRQIVKTVQESTEELSGISRSISTGTTEASSKISETSSFADDISARLSQATSHIVLTVESMEKVTTIVSNISKKSDNSSKSLNNALESMVEIQGASREIKEINEVVNEIAFQTNILSLNAAIEAARAGEYGKGFAVVAEEVRELSVKTTESASKIKKLIQTTNDKIESGSKLVKDSSSMLLEILREFKSVFRELDLRTGELRDNTQMIEQIDKAVENIRNIINENAAYIEEMAAASEDMSNHVKSLHGEVKRFKV